MALQDLMELSLSKGGKKTGLSEERIRESLPVIKQYIAYWREYPDMFVEFLCGPGNPENFHLFFYQRLFLRAVSINPCPQYSPLGILLLFIPQEFTMMAINSILLILLSGLKVESG